ncbi:MAG TPA: hypothetical protein VIY86_10520, partial [Pirellulaceae bacterium]
MKVVLPGSSTLEGTFHVRVRSFGTNLTNLTGGQTKGSYQLQIRLQSEDEVPGTSINLADIRFAESGITIVGPPSRSPLGGEQTEDGTLNDVIREVDVTIINDEGVPVSPPDFINHTELPYEVQAQDLGNVLATRQGATSVFGRLADAQDVDWYRVDFTYGDLQPSFATSFFNPDTVGVVFDIDYADGFGRPDTTLSVYNEFGALVYYSESSNVPDDQPGAGTGADVTDLSRGSAGTGDPFIGPVELTAARTIGDFGAFGSFFGSGTYYIAVSSAARVPDPIAEETAVKTRIGATDLERGFSIDAPFTLDYLMSKNPLLPANAILSGEYSLEIRTVDVPPGGFVGAALTSGDKNRKREQGLIAISSNQISNSREWGIRMVDSFRDLPDYPGDNPEILEQVDTISRLSNEIFKS